MIRRLVVALAALALAASSLSCAVSGGPSGPYVPRSMPAARAALPHEYRVFYDDLVEYGDWVLIEPYGFVFRPRVNFVAWRPYLEGWWQPSDPFGWVWISDEPFGWITYHYGTWFYDRFQGWVWLPGYEWGPAWVAWANAGDWYGWTPLGPPGYSEYDQAPGGVFTYVPAHQLAATGLDRSPQFVTTLAPNVEELKPVVNLDHVEGVVINRGPSFEAIGRAMHATVRPIEKFDVQRPAVVRPLTARVDDETEVLAATRRAFEAGTRELVSAREHAAAPSAPPAPRASAPTGKPTPRVAPIDSVRTGDGPHAKPGRAPAGPGGGKLDHGAPGDRRKLDRPAARDSVRG